MNNNINNKTDLIFHLGYDKCSSSNLQEAVFPQTKGYLGSGLNTPANHKFAKRFQALAPCGPSVTVSYKQAKLWADQVFKLKQTDFPVVNRLIVSSEFYIMNNILKTRPIIPFLKKFDTEIWHHGDVKIILILRNQAEKLALQYAQNSIAIPNASRQDFERFCDRNLKKYFENMNYSKCFEELYEAFGKDKVCVLLMEDIGGINFWEQLKQFIDFKEFNPENMVKGSKVNQRKVSKNKWILQEYDNEVRARYKVNNNFKFFWPGFILFKLREKAKIKVKFLLMNFYTKHKNIAYKDEKSIFLSETIKESIKKYYLDSNQRLGKLLDRDLAPLGCL